jgi:pentapeptide repeat protein
MVAILGAVFISLFTATVPDEPWEQYFLTHLPKCWVVEDENEDGNKRSERRLFWPTYVLFETEGAFFHRNLDLREKVLTVNKLPAKVINALRAGKMAEREPALQEVLGIDLLGRNLRDAELSKSILPKADLRGAQLQSADLRRAQLQGADLREARIGGAGFEDATLDFTESTRSRSQAAD